MKGLADKNHMNLVKQHVLLQLSMEIVRIHFSTVSIRVIANIKADFLWSIEAIKLGKKVIYKYHKLHYWP